MGGGLVRQSEVDEGGCNEQQRLTRRFRYRGLEVETDLEILRPGLAEHRVVDRVLRREVRVQRRRLHTYPRRDLSESHGRQTVALGDLPRSIDDLPPSCLS